MKKIVDLETVNARLNELRWNARTFSRWARACYEITDHDMDSSQLWRIVQKKRERNHFGLIEAAHHVLTEVAERKGHRLTLKESDLVRFKKLIVNDSSRLWKNKYFTESAFTIREGRVEVAPAIEKQIRADCTKEVGETETESDWLKALVSLVNVCPSHAAKSRLGRFAMQTAKMTTGVTVVEGGNGNLEVKDQQ